MDVKRALMRYDKVLIQSPDDRDVIKKGPPPPREPIQFSYRAEDMTPEIAERLFNEMDKVDYGPVRPLGKTKNYDQQFEQLYNQFKPAIRQGSLEVINYNPRGSENKPIVEIAEVVSESIYNHFKNLAFNQEFIAAVSKGIDKKLFKDNQLQLLSPSGSEDHKPMFSLNTIGGMLMDGTIDTSPIYQGSVRSLEERMLISKMCHARIGAIVKGLSICEAKGLQPFTTDPGFASVLQLLDQKFNEFVKQYQLELEYEEKQTEMEELRLLKRLDDFAFTEYIDAKALEGMSVKQILGTRTKAWSEFSEKRSEMVSKLKKITLENPDDIKFRSALDKLLRSCFKSGRG